MKYIQSYLILLYCGLLCFADSVFFHKLKVCDNCALSKSISTIFPTAFAQFISVSHFGNGHNIANSFIIIVFAMIWDQ